VLLGVVGHPQDGAKGGVTMKLERWRWNSLWATIRTHAVPITVSVTLSVAICRLSIVIILAFLGIAVALLIWTGGWKIEIRRNDQDQYSNEKESHHEYHA